MSRASQGRAVWLPEQAGALGAATRMTAIFGDPVEHSLSPAMHNAAYAALGLDRVYLAFRVEPGALRAGLGAISALGILGVNLTVPHKEAAMRMLGKTSAEARLLGAVNSVALRRGELYGDNTDARGLQRDLGEHGARAVRGRLAIVIGAGGGAAAAVVALARLGAGEVVIANRTRSRAAAVARRLRRAAGRLAAVAVEPRGLDALTDGALLKRASLIVNATPMGLTTRRFAVLDYRATSPQCFFYDLIYAREPTPFLAPAAALGRRFADGTGMLVHQGELAFRLFNRVEPPAGVMRRALMERLGRA